MEVKTWKEIENEIRNDTSINFIGRAISPLHVLGIESYVLHLRDQGITPKGFILVVPHDETGIGISEDCFHKELYEGVTPVILTDGGSIGNKWFTLLKVLFGHKQKNEIYFANPYRVEFNYVSAIADIRKDTGVHIVLTDEGGGSYLNNPYSFRTNRVPSWGFVDNLRFILYATFRDNALSHVFKARNLIEYFLMLKKVENRWQRNDQCCKQILRMLKTCSITEDYSELEDAVLICPGLLYEVGYLTVGQDVEIYKEILEKLGSVKCVVKPHPRERNLERYRVMNCIIEQRHFTPIEEILANIKKLPKCVIGESSTILTSAAVLFGVKTISINKLINREYLTNKKFFDNFNADFDELVLIPKTKEELDEILENI